MDLKGNIRWFFQGSTPGAQRARKTARLLIVLALFAGLFWLVPIDQVLHAMLSADPHFFALGTALALVSLSLTSVQIEPLTRNQGIKHSIGSILAINLAMRFYLQFTPSTIIASGFRWYRLAQPGGKNVEALVALGFFRVMETFITLAMGVAFWLLSGRQSSLEISVVWLVLIILAIILSWLVVTRYSLSIYRWLENHSGGFLHKDPWNAINRRIVKVLNAVCAYANMPALDLLLAITAGVLSALVGIASGVILARAVGIDLGFLTMGWIQAVILIATQLPFTVAGGLGIREVTLVAILATLGIGADLALALSFLLFIRGVLLSLLGGVLEAIDAIRGRRSSPAHPAPGDFKEL
jgi:uncharacterized protein (TIRG00374 family)